MIPAMYERVAKMKAEHERIPFPVRENEFDYERAAGACIKEVFGLVPMSLDVRVFYGAMENLTPATRLYHGTTTHALSRILEEGICPRDKSKSGNYPDMPSASGFIYLTQTHALAYATQTAVKMGGDPVILEVKVEALDLSRIYPDEDYLIQAPHLAEDLRRQCQEECKSTTQDFLTLGANHCSVFSLYAEVLEKDALVIRNAKDEMKAPGSKYDISTCQSLWRSSFNRLGNIAYAGVVPKEAICRVAVINDTTAIPLITQFTHELEYSLANTMLRRGQMLGLNRHIFEGSTLAAEWDDPAYLSRLTHEKVKWIRETKKQMRQEHRRCVRVFTPSDAPADSANSTLFGSKGCDDACKSKLSSRKRRFRRGI